MTPPPTKIRPLPIPPPTTPNTPNPPPPKPPPQPPPPTHHHPKPPQTHPTPHLKIPKPHHKTQRKGETPPPPTPPPPPKQKPPNPPKTNTNPPFPCHSAQTHKPNPHTPPAPKLFSQQATPNIVSFHLANNLLFNTTLPHPTYYVTPFLFKSNHHHRAAPFAPPPPFQTRAASPLLSPQRYRLLSLRRLRISLVFQDGFTSVVPTLLMFSPPKQGNNCQRILRPPPFCQQAARYVSPSFTCAHVPDRE